LGYLRKKNFIKFISVFWGVVGLFGLMGYILPSKIATATRLVVLAIPGIALIYAPTYGLGYFVPLNPELPFALYCLIRTKPKELNLLLGYKVIAPSPN